MPVGVETPSPQLLINEGDTLMEKQQSHQAKSNNILNQGNFILEGTESPKGLSKLTNSHLEMKSRLKEDAKYDFTPTAVTAKQKELPHRPQKN